MAYDKEGSKENVMLRFYGSMGGEMLVHPSANHALNQGRFGFYGLFLPYSDLFMPVLSHFWAYLVPI